jgi:hypothetical protein
LHAPFIKLLFFSLSRILLSHSSKATNTFMHRLPFSKNRLVIFFNYFSSIFSPTIFHFRKSSICFPKFSFQLAQSFLFICLSLLVWALDDPSSTVYVEVFRAFKPFAASKKKFQTQALCHHCNFWDGNAFLPDAINLIFSDIP